MGDRQLNDLWYSWLRVQPAVAVEQGWAWDHQLSAPVAAGASELLRMETGERAVTLFTLVVTTDGTRGVEFTMYIGGQIDLSAPLPGFPMNHERSRASPWADISDNGFLAVPGTEIISVRIDSAGRTVFNPDWILAPNQLYYAEITNLHNQAAQIEVEIIAGSIGGMIS